MRKRRLEEAFEECLGALLGGRRTIEECMGLYPGVASELESLLRTALEVNWALTPSVPAELVGEGRRRFLQAAAQRSLQRQPVLSMGLRRWMPALVGGVLGLALLGLAAAIVVVRDEGGPEPALVSEESGDTEPVLRIQLVRARAEAVQQNLAALETIQENGGFLAPEALENLPVVTQDLYQTVQDAQEADSLPPETVELVADVAERLAAVNSDALPQDAAQGVVKAKQLAVDILLALGVTPSPTAVPAAPVLTPTRSPTATPAPASPSATPAP